MFIIYGTRGRASVVDSGKFACPTCGGVDRPYLRKSVRRYFTIFFVPVMALDKAGEYVECQHCGGEFDEQALIHYEDVRDANVRIEFLEYVKRLMVLTAMADGEANEAEVAAIRASYGEIAGAALSKKDVERELYLARLARGGLSQYPRTTPLQLDDPSRTTAMNAALAVANADGPIGDDERRFLDQVAAEMGVEPGRIGRVS